jgi:pimeloyl-ACP methyl ester carboxylesterase
MRAMARVPGCVQTIPEKPRPATMTATCHYTVEGNPAGPTLLFVHGWPDDTSLWRAQVAALGTDHRCVLVTLPNFGARPENAGGFDFPDVVARLAATIRAVQPEGPVGLVAHDWGAYLGYLLDQAHPGLVSRMAALDVGGHLGRPGLKSSLMVIGYQWPLILAWWVGGLIPPLGDAIARGVGRVVHVPAPQRARIRSRFGYLYFYFWRNLLVPWKRSGLLSRYRPNTPVLYLWGERKPLQVHSPRWLEIVVASGGKAEGVPGAGHWLMESHADVVNAHIEEWFRANADDV